MKVPRNFASVENFVYRSGYPTPANFPFLEQLSLRTVVSLTPEEPSAQLLGFCAATHARSVHIPVERFADDVAMTPAVVTQVLELIIQPESHPLLLHCLDGENVVGMVVLCLRRLQNYALPAQVSEFCRFACEGKLIDAERDFLDAFRDEVTIPAVVPQWLWRGERHQTHPTLMLQHAPGGEVGGGAADKWDSGAPEPVVRGRGGETAERLPWEQSSTLAALDLAPTIARPTT